MSSLVSRHKILSIALPLLVIPGFVLFFAMPSFADAPQLSSGTPILSWLVNGLIGLTIGAINQFLGYVLTTLIGLLISVAQYSHFLDAQAVKLAWPIIRDLANMFIVVGLLVIAFGTILRLQNYHARALLPKLIFVAIIVNFSATITGFFIDLSQVAMMTFVNQFNTVLAGNFTQAFGIYNLASISGSILNPPSSRDVLVSSLLSLIFLGVACVVIGVLLVVLIVRILYLWILIIFSPIGFVGSAIPVGQKFASQWWEQLGKWLTVGPVLAFFIWLALSITYAQTGTGVLNIAKNTSTNQLRNVFVTDAGLPSHWVNFIVASAILLMGLMFAQQLGGAIGKIAGKGMSGLQWAGGRALHRADRWLAGGANIPGISKIPYLGKAINKVAPFLSPTAFKTGWTAKQKNLDEKAFGVGGGHTRDFFTNYVSAKGIKDIGAYGFTKAGIALGRIKKTEDVEKELQRIETQMGWKSAAETHEGDLRGDFSSKEKTFREAEEAVSSHLGQVTSLREQAKRTRLEADRSFKKSGEPKYGPAVEEKKLKDEEALRLDDEANKLEKSKEYQDELTRLYATRTNTKSQWEGAKKELDQFLKLNPHQREQVASQAFLDRADALDKERRGIERGELSNAQLGTLKRELETIDRDLKAEQARLNDAIKGKQPKAQVDALRTSVSALGTQYARAQNRISLRQATDAQRKENQNLIPALQEEAGDLRERARTVITAEGQAQLQKRSEKLREEVKAAKVWERRATLPQAYYTKQAIRRLEAEEIAKIDTKNADELNEMFDSAKRSGDKVRQSAIFKRLAQDGNSNELMHYYDLPSGFKGMQAMEKVLTAGGFAAQEARSLLNDISYINESVNHWEAARVMKMKRGQFEWMTEDEHAGAALSEISKLDTQHIVTRLNRLAYGHEVQHPDGHREFFLDKLGIGILQLMGPQLVAQANRFQRNAAMNLGTPENLAVMVRYNIDPEFRGLIRKRADALQGRTTIEAIIKGIRDYLPRG